MPITDVQTLKAALESSGLKPNKALGQNFFIDGDRMDAIVDASKIDGMDVLEIGPGMGALTERLLPRANRLIAVEKDAAMVEALQKRLGFSAEHADILRFDIAGAFAGDFCVVGNLPYYITTPIVERLLPLLPKSMTLMVQKEAAERFFAKANDRVYGPVAVLSQVFYTPARVMDVPRSCYYPQPDVDSSVVHLERVGDRSDGKAFLGFLNRAFAMRRKTLYNNLSKDARVTAWLLENGCSESARAESLPPDRLYALCQTLNG